MKGSEAGWKVEVIGWKQTAIIMGAWQWDEAYILLCLAADIRRRAKHP